VKSLSKRKHLYDDDPRDLEVLTSEQSEGPSDPLSRRSTTFSFGVFHIFSSATAGRTSCSSVTAGRTSNGSSAGFVAQTMQRIRIISCTMQPIKSRIASGTTTHAPQLFHHELTPLSRQTTGVGHGNRSEFVKLEDRLNTPLLRTRGSVTGASVAASSEAAILTVSAIIEPIAAAWLPVH
jgi:hypothetical protein